MASKTYPLSAFEGLRPFCIQLTVEQTVQNVKNLRTQISSTDVSALQDLLDYVLFPLRFTLKTSGPKKPGLVQAVLDCISHILSLTHLRSPVSLQEMFSELCSCLPPDPLQPVPEELKLAVVLAVQSLLRSSGADVLCVLYKPPMLPEMGFIITLLLRLAESEKSREIRLEALNCLERLLSPDLKQDTSLGDLFASFLPGVCTVLTRIICGDPKQGYRITTGAVKLWAGAVSTVMSDESLAQVPEKKLIYPGLSGRVAELMVHRDRAWVKHSACRLVIHLDKITKRCMADPHWKVRLALVDLAHLLHTQCWNSLAEAAGNLLRILVGHMSDNRPEVKARAREVLLEVSKDGPASRTLGEVLSESLHSLAVTLPRLLSSQDDQGKLHTLALLLGYLQLLGPRLYFTLHSPAHLQRLSSALLQTLQLDLGSVKVMEERLSSMVGTLNQQDLAHTGVQQKTFSFFRDPQILSYVQSVCRLLGYYGDFYLLTDHFLTLYRAQKLPAVIVLNQLVLGAAGIDIEALNGGSQAMECSELLDAIRPLLEEYTDPANWHLLTCRDSDEVVDRLALLRVGGPSNPAITDMTANAWKLCLQLEGISCFAQALGSNFRPLLISTLYPVLEKAGDPSLMVSEAAMVALNNVSRACGYKDVNQLIELNADYLASEVSVGLRRLRHGGAARVLHAMLDNCGPSLLPLLYELVQDLLPVLDQSQNDRAKILFPVLNSLVTRLGKWFPLASITAQPAPGASIPHQMHDGSMAQEIAQFLQDHIEQYRVAQGDVEEEEAADVLPPSDVINDDQKPPLSTLVQITKEVAEKCTHFLSHSDTQLRLQALDTLHLSLIPLHSQEDVLLPLAHKIWPCLVKRLLQDEPLVLLRAFQMLVSLAASCRDFIRPRVCKDALPAFLMSLRSQALVSCHAGHVYSHTLGFKLQKALLEGLGTLCVDLALGDSDLLEVIDSCTLYLSARQPKQLQEAASRTLLSLSQLDPDIVWLHLCEWQSPPEVPHPSVVPLPWTSKPHDEYTQNVCKLLQQLHGL
ncbi:LOW QUALITY PROTEIN: TELO2-interacting protein 1 homolog [Bufo gargarizans]|uniref:LOW QUALITY PROTEIN: TELO2-interacting protein 1 homolog n=1 Tax=Bufo gargarizans TaxID=30331 RepID=UPI001CF5B465|nr:LOW QUALITY PROTEIN: TELO2-interacting protein 1 homolog [Bufo gargarizans]